MISLNIETFSGYMVASAIRGPDSHDYSAMKVKQITTAVLRYFIHVSPDIGADVFSPLEAKHIWLNSSLDLKESMKNFWKSNEHFNDHFRTALGLLPHIVSLTSEYDDYVKWFKNVLDS